MTIYFNKPNPVLRTYLLLLLCLSVSFYGFSQVDNKTNTDPANNQEPGLEKMVYITVPAERSQGKLSSDVILNELKLSNDYSFVRSAKSSYQDKLGYTIVEMNQFYKGVKVEIAHMKAHFKNGRVAKINGSYLRMEAISTRPAIAPESALSKAVSQLGIDTPMWMYPEGAALANYEKPTGELVILTDFEDYTVNRLAWKFDVFAAGQPIRDIVYMDARTNELLYRNPIIKHANGFGHDAKKAKPIAYVPREDVAKRIDKAYEYTPMLAAGDADTKYSGNNRQVETLTINGTYSLVSLPNGVTVRTYDANNAPANSTSGITDITDPNNDNDWEASEFPGKAQGELDAHWGAEEVYDYWDAVHGVNSFDNAGASIFSFVHVQTNYNNAFWNGAWMSYGDGSCDTSEGCNGFDILTSMDVCAHEIGHAVMNNTANLTYQRESGGLNEGFADIWGAAIEFRSKGNGNNADPNDEVWLIGDEIDRRSGSVALRSMSNPNERFQPDTYRGTYWEAATVAEGCITPNGNPSSPDYNDYCGVHTNSGVLNYWFYLIVEGGSGTNDNGDVYNVSGIGMANAELIADRMQRVNITNVDATYADARIAGIQSAQDLYGVDSQQEITVTNAFYAVGVGDAYSGGSSDTEAPSMPNGLTSSNITNASFDVSWNASTDNVGVTGYEVFLDGASQGNTATTSYSFSGLSASTTYAVTVAAYDAAGNSSNESSALNVTTLSNGGSGCTTNTVNSEDFEGGFSSSIWNDGGSDARISINDQGFANSGVLCVRLRRNSGTSNISTDNLDLSSFEEITVNFSYITANLENGEGFNFQVSTNGGASYTEEQSWTRGTDFSFNNSRESGSVTLTGTFSSNTRLRFQNDGNRANERTYLDDIVITGCSNGFSTVIATTKVANSPNTNLGSIPSLLDEVKVYPNPADQRLNIGNLPANSRVVLTNISGQMIMDAGNSTQLDVSALQSGVYFLHIAHEAEGKTRIIKVVKE
ncbi:M4 family metallopeptidase [Aureisphaera sp.]